MPKKIKLADLEHDEKKKLEKVSFLSIFSVFVICVFIVSCFACSQNAGVQLDKEQQEELDRVYWTNEIVDTTWQVSTSDKNNGILEGQTMTMDLKFANVNGTICAYFSTSDVEILTGKLALEGSKGILSLTADGKKWNVKFSEKNNVMYLTISWSNGEVHYTSKK